MHSTNHTNRSTIVAKGPTTRSYFSLLGASRGEEGGEPSLSQLVLLVRGLVEDVLDNELSGDG